MADLRPRRALDRLLVRVRGDLLDAVHPAEPRGPRHRAARRRVRVPQDRAAASAGGRWPRRCSALASLLTPFFMGTVVGAIAGGRVPVGNAAGDAVTSWLNPLSLVIGALFVATSAYLAAVFLVSDARRAGAPDLERYFAHARARRRLVTGRSRPPASSRCTTTHGTSSTASPATALPLVILSLLCGGAVLVLLRRGARRGARPLAVGAVAAVIWGWGVAQHPYLLPQSSRSPTRRRRARPSPAC